MRGFAPRRPRRREAMELSREGETLAAKMRLSAAALASLVPLGDVLLGPPESEAWIGVGAGAAVVLLGTAVLMLARRPEPPRWLGLASCLLDVSILSLVNVAFVLAGNPLAATNSRVVFSCYFVALSLSCLRLDERLCAAAGLAALLQYGGIVLWAAHRFDLTSARFDHSDYGAFLAGNQVNRLALLAVATAIHVVTVAKLRGYWTAAIHDRLTGLHNREYAESRLAESLSQARRTARPVALALALVDLDHFKAVNDRWGHAAGDEVLRHTAEVLRRSFRASDVTARFGGEEFLIVFPDTGLDAALDRMRGLQASFTAAASAALLAPEAAVLTFSAGVAASPGDGETTADLLRRADERLYAAKQAGRNRVQGRTGAGLAAAPPYTPASGMT
jgi:two-component system cell cycle response regulator